MIFKLINFFIFALVLSHLLKKPVARFVTERREQMEKLTGTARITFESAKASEETMSERIQNIGVERGMILKNADSSAQREASKIIENANLYSERMKEDAKSFIRFEYEQITRELRSEVVNEAVELAKQELEKGMTLDADKKMAGKFLNELGPQADVR